MIGLAVLDLVSSVNLCASCEKQLWCVLKGRQSRSAGGILVERFANSRLLSSIVLSARAVSVPSLAGLATGCLRIALPSREQQCPSQVTFPVACRADRATTATREENRTFPSLLPRKVPQIFWFLLESAALAAAYASSTSIESQVA